MAEGGALRELLAIFQLEVPTEELEKGHEEIDGLIGSIRKFGEVVVEAFAVHAIKEFFEEQIEGAAHIADVARKLDISATSLKEFSQIAKSAGVGFDEAATGLGFLSRNLGEARIGGGQAAAAFQKLGVHLKNADGSSRDLFDVVGDVAEGFSKLPDQQLRAAYAMQIFGRGGRDLLPILAQDREALQEQLKEVRALNGGLGDEYFEASKKAREEGEKFGIALDTIKAKITIAALPAIMAMLRTLKNAAIGFVDFTKKTYVLKTGMIALSVIAGYKLVGSLGKMLKVMGLLKPSIGETLAAMLEFAVPLLIAGALYLVFDEFYTLMKGGKTIIGDTLNELTGDSQASYKAALFLSAGWADLVDTAKDFAAVLAGILIPILSTVWTTVKGIVNILADVLTGNFSGIAVEIDAANKEIGDSLEAGKNTIKNAWKDFSKGSHVADLQAQLAKGANAQFLVNGTGNTEKYSPATKSLLARLGASGVKNKNPAAFSPATKHILSTLAPTKATAPGGVVQHNTTHVTVHTSSDAPKAVGQAVGQGVATAHQKATNNAIQAVRRQ